MPLFALLFLSSFASWFLKLCYQAQAHELSLYYHAVSLFVLVMLCHQIGLLSYECCHTGLLKMSVCRPLSPPSSSTLSLTVPWELRMHFLQTACGWVLLFNHLDDVRFNWSVEIIFNWNVIISMVGFRSPIWPLCSFCHLSQR